MERRRALVAATAACLLAAAPLVSLGQQFPDRPIKLLVGFPPGQATDIVARLLGERLSAQLGQPVVIENKPGQGGSIALAQLAKAPADGYTLMLSATASLVVNPHLYKSVGYDTLKDFVPIATVVDLPLLLVAHPSMPFNTFAEFVAYAKANPSKLQHSSSGNGTLSHLGMELLKRDFGMQIQHIPYQGSVRAMTDLIAGNVNVGLDTVAVTLPHVENKRLKLIASASEKRLSLIPETPTIAESGMPGFSASAWLGLLAPRGTPPAAVERISAEVLKIVKDPAVEEKLRVLGAGPRAGTASEFDKLLHKEYESWGRVVRESGARVD